MNMRYVFLALGILMQQNVFANAGLPLLLKTERCIDVTNSVFNGEAFQVFDKITPNVCVNKDIQWLMDFKKQLSDKVLALNSFLGCKKLKKNSSQYVQSQCENKTYTDQEIPAIKVIQLLSLAHVYKDASKFSDFFKVDKEKNAYAPSKSTPHDIEKLLKKQLEEIRVASLGGASGFSLRTIEEVSMDGFKGDPEKFKQIRVKTELINSKNEVVFVQEEHKETVEKGYKIPAPVIEALPMAAYKNTLAMDLRGLKKTDLITQALEHANEKCSFYAKKSISPFKFTYSAISYPHNIRTVPEKCTFKPCEECKSAATLYNNYIDIQKNSLSLKQVETLFADSCAKLFDKNNSRCNKEKLGDKLDINTPTYKKLDTKIKKKIEQYNNMVDHFDIKGAIQLSKEGREIVDHSTTVVFKELLEICKKLIQTYGKIVDNENFETQLNTPLLDLIGDAQKVVKEVKDVEELRRQVKEFETRVNELTSRRQIINNSKIDRIDNDLAVRINIIRQNSSVGNYNEVKNGENESPWILYSQKIINLREKIRVLEKEKEKEEESHLSSCGDDLESSEDEISEDDVTASETGSGETSDHSEGDFESSCASEEKTMVIPGSSSVQKEKANPPAVDKNHITSFLSLLAKKLKKIAINEVSYSLGSSDSITLEFLENILSKQLGNTYQKGTVATVSNSISFGNTTRLETIIDKAARSYFDGLKKWNGLIIDQTDAASLNIFLNDDNLIDRISFDIKQNALLSNKQLIMITTLGLVKYDAVNEKANANLDINLGRALPTKAKSLASPTKPKPNFWERIFNFLPRFH